MYVSEHIHRMRILKSEYSYVNYRTNPPVITVSRYSLRRLRQDPLGSNTFRYQEYLLSLVPSCSKPRGSYASVSQCLPASYRNEFNPT